MAYATHDQTLLDANRATIEQHHAILNNGDMEGAAQFFAPDARNHGYQIGREGVLFVLNDIQRTFPDVRMNIIDLLADGEWVVARCQFSGTHRGVAQFPHHGGLLVGVEPTGRRFEVEHIHMFRMQNGLIIDHHATRDDVGMFQQLGLLPPPPPLPPGLIA